MEYLLHLIVLTALYAVLAQCQNLVLGSAGMLFSAQGAIFAIGAYAAGILVRTGVAPVVALAAAAVLSVIVAAPMGASALRLQGDYLLLASLGFCEIVRSVLNNWETLTGGAGGLTGIPSFDLLGLSLETPAAFAPLALCLLAATVVTLRLIESAPYGRLLRAIRSDSEAIRGLGKSVRRARISAVCFAALWSGLAGGIWAFYLGYLDPTGFTVWESVLILSMVIVGGTGSIVGVLLGSAILMLLPEAFRFLGLPPTVAAPLRQILVGVSLVLIMRFRPGGLLDPERKRRARRECT